MTVTSSGTVDTSKVGTYTITYTSTDASGNTGTETRTVNVVDTTGPDITMVVIIQRYKLAIHMLMLMHPQQTFQNL